MLLKIFSCFYSQAEIRAVYPRLVLSAPTKSGAVRLGMTELEVKACTHTIAIVLATNKHS